MERVKTIEEEIQKIINKYPIDLDTVDMMGKLTKKLSPSGATAWLKDMMSREVGESCDWCQGGAGDLIYNLENRGAWGTIDRKSGIMEVGFKENKIGGRRMNYCPMCGRPVGHREKEIN